MIRLWTPWLPEQSGVAVSRAIDGLRLGPGPLVANLEKQLAAMYGCRHAVCTVSGSAALSLAVKAVFPQGARVAVPAYGFHAAAEACHREECSLMAVDVLPCGQNYLPNMNSVDLYPAIEQGKIEGVIFVRHNSWVNHREQVVALCQKFKVPLIDDAACSVGLSYQPALGTDATILSFAVPKWATCGQGGAVLTDRDDVATFVRREIDHGGCDWRETRVAKLSGANLRLTDLQAALLTPQLPIAQERCVALGEWYGRYLGAYLPIGFLNCGWMPMLTAPTGEQADSIIESLADQDIEAAKLYPPIWFHKWASQIEHDCPNALAWWSRTVYLPSGPELTEQDVKHIASAVIRAAEQPNGAP